MNEIQTTRPLDEILNDLDEYGHDLETREDLMAICDLLRQAHADSRIPANLRDEARRAELRIYGR